MCSAEKSAKKAAGDKQIMGPRMADARNKRFLLYLIKPSHYDDDGYVIQWLRSSIPSNSLASLYGLAADCRDRQVLGEDVELEIEAVDETNTRIRPDRIAKLIKQNGGLGLVGLVGVQSNQFPRAMDIARVLRAEGIQVCIGGFHVSGCLAMLPEMPDDMKEAQRLGISFYAGEAEGRLDRVLKDAARGRVRQHLVEPTLGLAREEGDAERLRLLHVGRHVGKHGEAARYVEAADDDVDAGPAQRRRYVNGARKFV